MAEPNFALQFPDVPGKSGWQLTLRTADVLHTALCTLADGAYNDIEAFGGAPVVEADDWEVLGRLPRLAWNMDSGWRRRFARAADDLAADLESGTWPRPRCSGEELMLHLALADAPDLFADMIDGTDGHEALPARRGDYDWAKCSEVLFEDSDVMMFFDPGLDGFEDPLDKVNRDHGIGDLRPVRWFDPFAGIEERDLRRGFRR
ncbi:hypothetical protein AB0M43_37630 [Longispora sp. NPDC051575]|uniref:hypothetical protein n=1 Tax=Longispora sp. NPDC051575 TaxID=3154943 RepID=UPI00341449DF